MVIEGHELTEKQKAELDSWDVFTLPFVTDCKQLPKRSGVYFLVVGAEILYVGQTWRLDLRWRHHKHAAHLTTPGARIAFIVVPKHLQIVRAQIEQRFIKRFKPRLNKQQLEAVRRAEAQSCGDVPSPG